MPREIYYIHWNGGAAFPGIEKKRAKLVRGCLDLLKEVGESSR